MSELMVKPHRSSRTNGPHAAPVLRVLLVLFFCAGIAFLGLLAGGEHRLASARGGGDPMAGYFSSGMPRYPAAEETPAGPAGRVGGSRLKMAFFVSEDEPLKVADYYAAIWRAKRFFVHHDVTHRGGFVSAVDAEHALIYQVLLQSGGEPSVGGGSERSEVREGERGEAGSGGERGEGGSHRTLVFPSETTLPAAASQTSEPPPLPLPPESRVLLTVGSREAGHDSRVHLSVNDRGLEANVAHFEREATAAGWRLESNSGAKSSPSGPGAGTLGPGHHMFIFRKPDRELTIDISLLSGKRVRVHLMEVGS